MEKKEIMTKLINTAINWINNGENPFSACITDSKNNIISNTQDKVSELNDLCAHAEVIAIKYAQEKLWNLDLSGYILYSTFEPCPICFTLAHLSNIQKIVYWINIDSWKKRGYLKDTFYAKITKENLNSKIELEWWFMEEECLKLIDLWENKNIINI